MSQKGIDRNSATLTHRVTEMLRREIVHGEREAGTRLSEVAIAAAYDVSRGPVREAIQRLVSDGLVVVESHRGAFVRRLARSRSGSTAVRAALALAEHDELIEHLAAQDPEKASLAMRRHLSGALANTLALMYSS